MGSAGISASKSPASNVIPLLPQRAHSTILGAQTRFLVEVCSLDGRSREGSHRHLPAFASATRALVYRTAKRDLFNGRALVGRPQSAGTCGTALRYCRT